MATGLERFRGFFERIDARVVAWMDRSGIRVLRIALAIVFIWFGALKVIGRSPVADLVAQTVYWFDPAKFVPVLGLWEICVGIGLLFRLMLRVTLLLFWLLLAGTFSVLLVNPHIAFQGGNPLLLTMEGEFVVKNLVLIAAGLVIGSTVRRPAAPTPKDSCRPA